MNSKKTYFLVEVFMVTLVFLDVCIFAWELTHRLTAEEYVSLHRIDIGIALIFLTEFFIRFYLAQQKKAYLRSHCLYLLAAIPISLAPFQAMRILRLLRLTHIHVLVELYTKKRQKRREPLFTQ